MVGTRRRRGRLAGHDHRENRVSLVAEPLPKRQQLTCLQVWSQMKRDETRSDVSLRRESPRLCDHHSRLPVRSASRRFRRTQATAKAIDAAISSGQIASQEFVQGDSSRAHQIVQVM